MGVFDWVFNQVVDPVASGITTAVNAVVPTGITNPAVAGAADVILEADTKAQKALYGDMNMSDKELDERLSNDDYLMTKVHTVEEIPYNVVNDPETWEDMKDFVPFYGCADRIGGIVEDAQEHKSAVDDGVNAGIDCVADGVAIFTFGGGEGIKALKGIKPLLSTAVPGTKGLVKVGAGERLVSNMLYNDALAPYALPLILPADSDDAEPPPEPEPPPKPDDPNPEDDSPTPVNPGRVERATPTTPDELVVVSGGANRPASNYDSTQRIALAIVLGSVAWALVSVKI